jgi:GT2 family glycosyltransferase
MSTAAPPPQTPPEPGPAGSPTDAPPAVVAVVVTRNPGAFLEDALWALGAQDYRALSVLVVDAGSDRDPTARVAAALPGAFVRRLDGHPGFGGAANEALEAVHGAPFFLLCHDDVVLDPGAVRIMVEEAFRSNAAIVGPKLVDATDPTVLLEVGRAIDRLGGSHTGIEPGEVDQEQHDAVRDVFYVSSAAMLVRSDLFDELDGFDPETFPGSEDLDLCWRARLAGARVMVAPDARAIHHEAAADRASGDLPTARDVARRRARVVLTCYSRATLLWVVPLALTVAFVEAILFSVTSRRRAAFAGLGAWWWNLFHRRRYRDARRRAQALRRLHDSELHELQVGVGASFGAFLSHHRADERMESIGERGRDAIDSASEAFRHPASIAFVAFLAFVLFGSRDLFSQGVPEIGTLVPWAGVQDSLAELSSAWRHTGLGSTTSAPPVLGLMAALGTVLLGGTGLAQTLVVVGAFVLGSVGAFRLARCLDATLGAGAVTALVYGVVAVPRNGVANGRLGPLVLYALAPFLVLLMVRAAGFAGTSGTSRRPLLGLALVTALATAWYPPAILLTFAAAIAFLVVSPFAREAAASLRALGAALVAAAGAAVLLVPWTAVVADVGSDRASLGIAFRPDLDLSQVLRFETGPNGAGIAAWGLVAAAAAALVVARGPRLAWAIRGWGLAILGYAAVYLPARLAPDAAVPAPEAALAVAALGLAIAAGVTVSAAAELVRDRKFGWRQVVATLAVAGVAVGALGFVGDTFSGKWRASSGWGEALAFSTDSQRQGQFRILWLGDPSVLPLDPVEIDDSLSYTLTRNGPGDAREMLRAPVTDADAVIDDAVASARDGDTSRLGRILAPLGVRYVAFTLRNGEDGELGVTPPGVSGALDDQLDLALLGSPPGIVLYENLSWAPARALVPEPRAAEVPTGAVDPLAAAARVDLAGARPIGDQPVPPGTALLAEAFDDGWSATGGGQSLEHEVGFGVTNAFPTSERSEVKFSHDGQGRVYLLLLIELVLWAAAIFWWSRGRRSAARERHERVRVERRERERHDFLDDLAALGDDVEFWEQG